MSEFNYEIIDQYLSGELAGEELAAFEKQLQQDPALAREVALYKALGNDLKIVVQPDAKAEALQKKIAALNDEFFNVKAAPVVKMKRLWWAVAAAIAAAIVVVVIRPFGGESFDNKKLFIYYAEKKDDLSPVQRGGSDDTVLIKAAQLYNKQLYQEALPLLDGLVLSHPDDKDLLLAKGISLLQTEQLEKAISVFEELIKSETVYKNQGAWFKALTLLKLNKLIDCQKVLQYIPTGSDKYEEAQELIKKIQKQLK